MDNLTFKLDNICVSAKQSRDGSFFVTRGAHLVKNVMKLFLISQKHPVQCTTSGLKGLQSWPFLVGCCLGRSQNWIFDFAAKRLIGYTLSFKPYIVAMCLCIFLPGKLINYFFQLKALYACLKYIYFLFRWSYIDTTKSAPADSASAFDRVEVTMKA